MKMMRFITVLLILLGSMEANSKSKLIEYPAFNVRVQGKGIPVILISGIGCSSDVWDETIKVLSLHYQCHSIQINGFAGAPPAEGFEFREITKGIIEYIKYSHLKKVILIGHSSGGLAAIRINLVEPDLVYKTIVLDTYPGPLKLALPDIAHSQEIEQAEVMSKRIQEFSPEQFDIFIRNTLNFSVTDTLKLSEIKNWYKLSDRKTLAGAYRNYLSTDLIDSLSFLKKPLLVLGACGSMKPLGISEEKVKENFEVQYKNAKNAIIRISDTCRHFIMYDDFNWMIANIEDFLNDQNKKR